MLLYSRSAMLLCSKFHLFNLENMACSHDCSTRAQAITLKILSATYEQIQQQTDIPRRTVLDIYARAIEQDFDPKVEHPIIRDIHVQDAPRSGRTSKQTEENKEEILSKV